MTAHLELKWNVREERNLHKFIKVLEILNMNYSQIIIQVEYDKDVIALKMEDNVIEVETFSKKLPFIRKITLQKIDIHIDSDYSLNKLLQISSQYDAVLTFTFKDTVNSKAEIIINDNGHDYINFDTTAYDVDSIKIGINSIHKESKK